MFTKDKKMNRELGIITKATLEIKERGILNFYIYIDYENGCSQVIGGLALDEYNKGTKERIGTAYGCEMIRQLLLCLNVNDFAEMKGTHLWVIGDGYGFGFKVKGIQALKDNGGKKVIFNDIYEKFAKDLQ